MNLFDTLQSSHWEKKIQTTFWIAGLITGAIVVYTTRYQVTTDAIPYIEIGEAFLAGNWSNFISLTWSSGYPVLLSIGKLIFNPNPLNEILWYKIVNIVIFIGAMAACDLLLTQIRHQYKDLSASNEPQLPFFIVSALCYSTFLFVTIDWIKLSTIAPDLLALTIFLVCMSLIVRIRQSCDSYLTFILFGIAAALGFITRTYFLPLSTILILTAFLACGSWEKAIPRVLASIIVLAILSSPFIYVMSKKTGRISFGEAGTYNYTKFMERVGKPKHPPILLLTNPEVAIYTNQPFGDVTDPRFFDTAFWHVGEVPIFDLKKQMNIVIGCFKVVIFDSPWFLLGVVIWFLFYVISGCIRLGSIWPLKLPLLLIIPAVAGFSFFCIVQMQMRYIAPFVLTAFLGLYLMPQYTTNRTRVRTAGFILSSIVVVLILGLTLNSVVDQSLRCLYSSNGKPSRKAEFAYMNAITDFLWNHGVHRGDYVALVGFPQWHWARMAGVKIMGRICGWYDQDTEFFTYTPVRRAKAIQTLKPHGIKALIGRSVKFSDMEDEGWRPIPKAKDYYIYLYTPQKHSGLPTTSQRH